MVCATSAAAIYILPRRMQCMRRRVDLHLKAEGNQFHHLLVTQLNIIST
jgi:hypothetical protein